MSGPDPTCLVGGVLPPADVAAGAAITITLASPAGARFWAVTCIATDELTTTAAVNATISIDQTTKTATCTLPNTLGTAYIFQSQVGINNLTLDANGVVQKSFTTTFKVNIKATNGNRVLAANELVEQFAIAGWIAVINPSLRAGTGAPSITVGGTGFAHVTSGAFDANARAVNLASNGTGGDVTGTTAVANGGTGIATGTAHGVAVFEGTSPMVAVGPAASGKLLQFKGVSADPAPSNFTLADPGPAGNVPVSDGTNWTSGPGSFGTIGNSGNTVTTTYTLAATDFNTKIAAGAIITGPASPLEGATYRLTTVSGEFASAPASFVGNGYHVAAPDDESYDTDATQPDPHGGVALTTSGAVYAWWWDGTAMRLA